MSRPGITIKKSDVDAIAKCNELKPTESDLKGMRGYYEREAKVMRTGVGYVDGREWGVEGGDSRVLGEAMAPFWRADNERIANKRGFEPHRRMHHKGKRTMIADAAGNLWKRVGEEWVQCD